MTKRVWPAVSGFLVTAGAYLLFAALWTRKHPDFDTDRWFHLALSRMWSERGIAGGVIRSLPQVEDLNWGKYFPDKEFLFHVFTTGAYTLGGEAAVRIFGLGLALTLLAVLYFFVQKRVGPWRAVALTVPLMLMVPCFSLRLIFIRAYLVAMLFVAALVISLWEERPWGAALAAAGYALCYHAFIVPLAICLPALIVSRRFGPTWGRAARYALCGFGVGSLVNPYFPANLVAGWQHSLFALRPSLPPGMEAGGELVARRWVDFVICYYPHLLVLGLCAWFIGRMKDRGTREKCLFFWAITMALWGLTLINPRASEYAVCLTVLVAGMCLAETPIAQRARVRRAVLALAGVLLFSPAWYWIHLWRMPPNRTYQIVTQDIRQALARIPSGRPAKVLNCDWGLGAYILHFRPDLRFVDLLDPRFLREAKPEHFNLLAALKTGRVVDQRGVVADAFGAQYVLCQRPDMNDRLRADPAFASLFRSVNSPVEVFAVVSEVPRAAKQDALPRPH